MSAIEIVERPEAHVFTLRIPPRLELADAQAYLTRVEQALETGQPFGAVFEWTGGRPRKSRGVNRAEHDWLEQHRGRMAQLCWGIAMVSEPSLAAALPRLAMRAAGSRMFGCPCGVVDDEAEALVWLAERRPST